MFTLKNSLLLKNKNKKSLLLILVSYFLCILYETYGILIFSLVYSIILCIFRCLMAFIDFIFLYFVYSLHLLTACFDQKNN